MRWFTRCEGAPNLVLDYAAANVVLSGFGVAAAEYEICYRWSITLALAVR